MTATTTQTRTDTRRCAFCKIDRKGRFILADRVAQRLFGLSEVELFGRPFVDFLDPADHEAFVQMTENRNPYETVFDAVDVDLFDKNGQPAPVTLIVSVNFGGGNPANYQVLVCPHTAEAPAEISVPERSWPDFIDLVNRSETVEDVETLGRKLQGLIEGATIAIYDVGPDRHAVLFTGGSDLNRGGEGDVDLDLVPAGDADADNGSPDDIRATFALADHRVGLVVISVDRSDRESAEIRHRAELAAITLHSFCPPLSELGAESGAQPSATVAEILDRLEMGWIEIDGGGVVRQRNKTFDTLFGSPANLSSVRDLTDLIAARAGLDCAATIRAYFEASSEYAAAPRLQLCLAADSEPPIAMTFDRTAPGTEDIGGCFLFSRLPAQRASVGPLTGLSSELSTSAIGVLRSSITAARSVGRKLEHEHHNELGRDGGFYLKCLSRHLSNVDGVLGELNRTLELIREPEHSQRIDVGLLVEKVLADLTSFGPYADVSLKCPGLPKIQTFRRRLTAVLHDILRVGLERHGEAVPEFRVTANMTDGRCCVRIEDKGPRVTKKQARRLFDLSSCLSQIRVGDQAGARSGLAFAREILRAMGGRIELDGSRSEGCAVVVTLQEEAS